MEKPANQLIEKTQEAHVEVTSFNLKLMRDKNEYLDVKANFFENQTLIINEIIHKIELKCKKLSIEDQELSEKLEEGAEVKKNLANILKCLKSQQKVKRNKSFIKIKGFYHCPECPYKTKWTIQNLKFHINAVHRKLKPWKCSNCAKDFALKPQLSQHILSVHNTNKGWICDRCGARFGVKDAIKRHMMSHLPPSFSCSECDQKFVQVSNLNRHKKLHQRIYIFNEICKLCNKGYTTKKSLNYHILLKHFAKFHCEMTGCSTTLSSKSNYKTHLITLHKKGDHALIEKLLEKLEKLKPNLQQLKYVLK